MEQQQPHRPRARRRLSRAEIRRRRRARAMRRIGGLVLAVAVVTGGVSFFLSSRGTVPEADAAGAVSTAPTADAVLKAVSTAPVTQPETQTETQPEAGGETTAPAETSLGLTAAEAQAMLDDPLMVLVNHTNKMPDGYTFDTAKCGSPTSKNNTLQTAACEAFLRMQAAAEADGVTVWMQSGYRSVDYQSDLYTKKTNYYLNQGFDEATAKEKAAAVVNPPGYSEHNCGLAADLNSPEFTDLSEGFKNTKAYAWLCGHAGEYGFILRYPEGREDVTDIIYEPWHWRYVGVENAARINASGLVFEEYIAELQRIVAQQ